MRPRLKRHYYSAHYASLCIILGCISHIAIILLFGVLTVKYHEMTKNYIFREFECGLTREQTAKLCFKSVRTITDWDSGRQIPPECKRLMRLTSNKKLSDSPEWEGFTMSNDKLQLPNGLRVTPQQILCGIALIEIGANEDRETMNKLIRYARIIASIKNK